MIGRRVGSWNVKQYSTATGPLAHGNCAEHDANVNKSLHIIQVQPLLFHLHTSHHAEAKKVLSLCGSDLLVFILIYHPVFVAYNSGHSTLGKTIRDGDCFLGTCFQST